MKPSRQLSKIGGFALLAVFPWAIAAVSLMLAAGTWFRWQTAADSTPKTETAEPTELKTLRLALETSKAENAALRHELDRLVGRGRGDAQPASAGTASPAPGGAAPGSSLPPEQLATLSSKLQESLSRAANGDQASAREAAIALMQVLKGGKDAFPALRDAYLATTDPRARLMMLPSMIFGGGEEARELIIDQVKTETDPDLRRTLLLQAAGFATPQYAPALKDTFLQTVTASDTDATTRAAAIRGLRYARGQEVQEALLAAAADPSDDIRLAAMENLASRPAMRESLRDAIGRETSSRVREIGQCRLLIAESGG